MSAIPTTHRLTSEHEIVEKNDHYILPPEEGYVGHDSTIFLLQKRGILLPQLGPEIVDPGRVVYVGTRYRSLRGFLNSTKIDKESIEKRNYAMDKIKMMLFNLAEEGVTIRKIGSALTYKDVAFDFCNFDPAILPTGIEVDRTLEYDEYGTVNTEPAHQENQFGILSITRSIVEAIREGDPAPFLQQKEE